MLLFALLAPFGAIILSLLLVVAVSYAAVYAGLYHLFNSCFRPDRRQKAGSGALENVVKRVNMLGLHIEAEPGKSPPPHYKNSLRSGPNAAYASAPDRA